MTPLATIIYLLVLASDTAGQLAFKAAAVHGGQIDGWKRWKAMAGNHWIWIGLAAYGVMIVSWLSLLSLVPLSVAILLGSLNIMCVMVGGRIFFNEKITRTRALAVTLVALGVFLVGWSSR